VKSSASGLSSTKHPSASGVPEALKSVPAPLEPGASWCRAPEVDPVLAQAPFDREAASIVQISPSQCGGSSGLVQNIGFRQPQVDEIASSM